MKNSDMLIGAQIGVCLLMQKCLNFLIPNILHGLVKNLTACLDIK